MVESANWRTEILSQDERRDLEELNKTTRLLEIQLATLRIKKSSGEIDEESFRRESETLERGLSILRKESIKLKEVLEKKRVSEPILSREKVLSILSDLPIDKAFRFYTDYDQYTGRYARNLEEFSESIREVDSRSIRFHIRRRDFQAWIRSINDPDLASQIDSLTGLEPSDEVLKKRLNEIVKARIEILRKSLR